MELTLRENKLSLIKFGESQNVCNLRYEQTNNTDRIVLASYIGQSIIWVNSPYFYFEKTTLN
jgi:choline kinase